MVEMMLTDLPPKAAQRGELRGWADSLDTVDDPVGAYAYGYLALHDADAAKDLGRASKLLSEAINHLGRAVRQGHTKAYFFLLQACLNLHNVERQAGNTARAVRASQLLSDNIENMPANVPAQYPRMLAERLEQLIRDREAGDQPHPQAAFLRTTMRRLHEAASQRGDTTPAFRDARLLGRSGAGDVGLSVRRVSRNDVRRVSKTESGVLRRLVHAERRQ